VVSPPLSCVKWWSSRWIAVGAPPIMLMRLEKLYVTIQVYWAALPSV